MGKRALADTTRRNFLRQASLGLGAAPFVPLLDSVFSQKAFGASPQMTASGFPKRMVLFMTPHPSVYKKWSPTGTATNFTLSSLLAPLAPLQHKICVLDGLQMNSSNPAADGGHIAGAMQMWTGSACAAATNGGGDEGQVNNTASLDQVLAQKFGNATPYPSLGMFAGTGFNTVSFAGQNQLVNPASNPVALFQQLFPNGNSAPNMLKIQQRISILDNVIADTNALLPKLAAADRAKLQAHLQTVRDLEVQIQSQAGACKAPDLSGEQYYTSGGSPYSFGPAGCDAMFKLASAALTCDMTRYISILLGQWGNDGSVYDFLGQSVGHHQMTHMTPSDTLDTNGNPVTDQKQSVNGQLEQIQTWYAQMFYNFIAMLDAVPEGNGTLLDNTLVVWGYEFADSYWHTYGPNGTDITQINYLRLVVAGGAGGSISMGRYLDYRPTPNPVYLQRLLVSMANTMGLPVTTFGDLDFGSGPLSGL